MNYCDDCRVYVDGSLRRCPLCGKTLSAAPTENELYPEVAEEKFIDPHTFMTDLFMFLTFIFIGGAILLNLTVDNSSPWFLLVVAPILYTWILVRNTILSDVYTGVKMLFQMLGIMGICLAYDFVFGCTGWSVEYVLPVVLVAGLVYIDLYAYIHKSKWRDNVVYALVFVALGILPLILYVTGVTHTITPMVLCTVASGVTVLGLLRFAVRRFTAEMKKRLHF